MLYLTVTVATSQLFLDHRVSEGCPSSAPAADAPDIVEEPTLLAAGTLMAGWWSPTGFADQRCSAGPDRKRDRTAPISPGANRLERISRSRPRT